MRRSRTADTRESIERSQARAEQGGHGSALIVCSLSGIQTPSRLAALEERCSAQLRRCDSWGSIGPDRFAILLPFADEDRAQHVWHRLWQGLGEAPVMELRVTKGRVRVGEAREGAVLAEAADDATSLVDVHPHGVVALLAQPLPRWKRALDVIGASVGLVLLAPLMAAIALAIKLTSRGPVFFLHDRAGHALDRFPLIKFRTMRTSATKEQAALGTINEMSGPLFKVDRDPRLTPIGRFLRITSLDEVPQLWNVLRGQMSLIGPRALSPRPESYEPWHLERFLVCPGLACTWQAYHRAETDFDAWMRSDIEYAKRPESPWADLRLFFGVARSVLRRDGAR